MQALAPGEQMRADRALGRRLMDLKRLGSLLPKIPVVAAESTPGPRGGRRRRGQRNITGVSWSQHKPGRADGRAAGRLRHRAWCGKCGESTTHSIVAMVGTEPKQILCQVCGSRHAYRTGPARQRPPRARRWPPR
jgi:hypothetical protein